MPKKIDQDAAALDAELAVRPEQDAPAAVLPRINGFVAQCEQCSEPSYPLVDVGPKAVVKGLCGAHGPVRTVEQWATAKKMLPQPFGQARMLRSWVTGAEKTEQEFDEAIADVANIRHG